MTIKEIQVQASVNSVDLYTELLYLIAVEHGETLTLKELGILAKQTGLGLQDYILYKWQTLS